jgi:hypothetical protein
MLIKKEKDLILNNIYFLFSGEENRHFIYHILNLAFKLNFSTITFTFLVFTLHFQVKKLFVRA